MRSASRGTVLCVALGWVLALCVMGLGQADRDVRRGIVVPDTVLSLAQAFRQVSVGGKIEISRSIRETVRDEILSLKASLLSSVRSAESLTLETEKWRLEEQVMTAKRAAGSISDSDWAQFLEEKGAFEIDAAGRATSLLVAHLTYRNALGMELNWEEWL